MKKNYILACLLFSFTIITKSQNTTPIRIGIEIGFAAIEGDVDSRWNIRQDLNSYGGNLNRIGMRGAYNELLKTHLGVLPTFYFMEGRVDISSGLRLTMFSGKIGSNKIDDKQSYFFFRHSSPNDDIEFYRIRKIDEKVHYLSIPLEASVVLLGHRSN